MTATCRTQPFHELQEAGTWRPQLRRFPYPYRAMMAICSDLDETPNAGVYREIMRFLNTTETTSMGRGVGLEVGNTIYFDMAPGEYAYWNTDDAGRELARALMRSGHIDCLHSYGDLATTRAHAARALDELVRHECALEVWIDHAVAATNLGADIMMGHGDVVGHEAYHADLTCDYGIKYVWRGRVTSVIGQGVPRDLGGIFDMAHPVRSATTIGKEWLKGVKAGRGDPKYAMHAPNDVVRHARLRDERPIIEFLRSNPFWGGPGNADTANELPDVITRRMLERLIERQGFCVFYTHLGKIQDCDEPFGARTQASFRCLAEFQGEGQILTATTRRLLGYARALSEVAVTTSEDDKGLRIDLATPTDGDEPGLELNSRDLSGLTFYVPDARRVRIAINGREVLDLRRNDADETGRASVSLPWHAPLEFPDV